MSDIASVAAPQAVPQTTEREDLKALPAAMRLEGVSVAFSGKRRFAT